MNQEHLLEMLRARLPRDPSLLESFLRYQAAHFDEDWDSLIQHFMTHRERSNHLFKWFSLRRMSLPLWQLVHLKQLMTYSPIRKHLVRLD